MVFRRLVVLVILVVLMVLVILMILVVLMVLVIIDPEYRHAVFSPQPRISTNSDPMPAVASNCLTNCSN
ncbi:hypothetical protein CDO87_07375 [Sagittula sp. P11]|nr:hypothetical protein CDO87_07375 [Sagittula sp. P11]